MNNIEYFTLVGKHFGYPSCCIEAFIKKFQSGDEWTEVQKKAGDHTGFVPCLDHANKIVSNEMKLSDVIVDRKHSVDFPEISDVEFFKFKDSLDA